MRDHGKQHVFLDYLWDRRRCLALFALFGAVFAGVFALYRLPLESVWYASLLCMILGVAFLLAGYYRYIGRMGRLEELKEEISLSLDGLLTADSHMEQAYQELIRRLYKDNRRLTFEADRGRRDMVDYYTMWVHQIKTPISAMRLLIETRDELYDAELKAELFQIEQYVEMVLQYLRLGSDATDYLLKPCSLDQIVKQAVRKYAMMFVRKKLKLDYRELNCQVLTDEKWLSFVIEQILSNAIKYTSQGTVSIYMDPESPKTLVIEDTGIGIAKEDLPRIFEKGFTGYNGRMDKKSTGIGLYLARQAADRLSHKITVDSEKGRGTRVKVCMDTRDLHVE